MLHKPFERLFQKIMTRYVYGSFHYKFLVHRQCLESVPSVKKGIVTITGDDSIVCDDRSPSDHISLLTQTTSKKLPPFNL